MTPTFLHASSKYGVYDVRMKLADCARRAACRDESISFCFKVVVLIFHHVAQCAHKFSKCMYTSRYSSDIAILGGF